MNTIGRQGRPCRQKQISRIRKSGKVPYSRTVRHSRFEKTQIICYLWNMIKAAGKGQKTRASTAGRLSKAVKRVRRQMWAKTRRYSLRRKRRDVNTTLILAAMTLSVMCLFTFVIGIDRVSGGSMYLYLNHGDWIVYNCPGERFKRDAMAVFKKDGRNFVKRVMGLPGNTVEIGMSGECMVINGSRAREWYVALTDPEQKRNGMGVPLTMTGGQYLMLGDDRDISIDGHDRGMSTMTEERIFGTIILIARTDKKPG